MLDSVIGRCVRALRHRHGWRQRDVVARIGVARSVLSDLEAGRIGSHSVETLRSVVGALGGLLRIEVHLPGGDIRRLLDADHAAVQERWAQWLTRIGWSVGVEVTFSRYGERGSIDILAWHAATGTLLVIEIKTVIVDVQSLLAGLDRKVRNAPFIARERGWQPQAVVPVLIVLEGTTARRRIAEHPALFARFALRGRAGSAWLRNPVGGPAPRGILLMTKLPKARSDDRRRAGRQRIRTNAPVSRSDQAGSGL